MNMVADPEVTADELHLRFRTAFDSAPIGMALVAPDGSWIDANDAVVALLGYDLETLQTLTFQDVTHPDDLEADLSLLARLVAGEIDRYSFDKRYLHANGHTVWATLSVSLVRERDGSPAYFVSQIIDITERKRTERTLLDYARRLARSNEELVEFASVAAHDLSQPLRAIENSLELLTRDLGDRLTDDERRDLERAATAATELQALIGDLLTYAQVTDTRVVVEDIALGDVVDDVLTTLAEEVTESGAQVDVGELPTVRGNVRQLGQLVQNLIANALKFTRPGEAPVVSITSEPVDGGWEVEVSDHGIGIAESDRELVFRMFGRTAAGRAFTGTGIGLAICRKVVESLGGRIWIAPSPVGTRVRVFLPGE